ncbi:MAG: 2-oxoacid:ferredoxin oxidoreductase subunit beta [Candidatus Promineifilaceae bacterium]|jgi:2-oxoglutarate ferredoxin oxidoreductase subunit beta
MESIQLENPVLSRKDFMSDQDVRWCPGCGDYSILAQIQKSMPEIGVPKENIVFISGIGCSSRFPYYMNTYGIHSIHGRAPTLATGLKIANPDLSVWVITGDGDGLSIGGNHLLHACRRNIDINIVLFNNRIYGLTKGQYSPTSRRGTRTKSSPMGSLEYPVYPLSLALSAEATFVARSIDTEVNHLGTILKAAAEHKGTSFVEVYQNCLIFNPDEWTKFDSRKKRQQNIMYLENGKPLTFGENDEYGVRLKSGGQAEIVTLGNGVGPEDLMVHDTSPESPCYAFSLTRIQHPVPMGIFWQMQRPTYSEGLQEQVRTAQSKRGVGDLDTLYQNADLWEVSADPAV